MKLAGSKLVLINLLVFSFLILCSEVFLGKWFKFSYSDSIPEAFAGIKLKYKSNMFGYNESDIIRYSRDYKGYRGKFIDYNIEQILSIGGSTSDQRFISDGETYQDIIQSHVGDRYSVLNGGVDGQSLFGHVYSMKRWHSKSLKSDLVKHIIFLIGANDRRLINSSDRNHEKKSRLRYDSPSIKQQIKNTLSKKSYLYGTLKKLKLNLFKNQKADNLKVIGHGKKVNFLKADKIPKSIRFNMHPNSDYYKTLFKELINTTKNSFPSANLYVVQQQDPSCKFDGKYNFSIKAAYKNNIEKELIIDNCKRLGQVFLAQDKILDGMESNIKIRKIKMYIDYPIPEEGFYDAIHTNTLGSRVLGEYLIKKIKF